MFAGIYAGKYIEYKITGSPCTAGFFVIIRTIKK